MKFILPVIDAIKRWVYAISKIINMLIKDIFGLCTKMSKQNE